MAGLGVDNVPAQQVTIRGRIEPMQVHALTDASLLDALVAEAEATYA